MKLIRQSEVYLMEEAVTDSIIKNAAIKQFGLQHTAPAEETSGIFGSNEVTQDHRQFKSGDEPNEMSTLRANKENFQNNMQSDQPTNLTFNVAKPASQQQDNGVISVENYVKEQNMQKEA